MLYTRQRTGMETNESIQDSELRMMLNLSLASLDEILATNYEDYHLRTYLATLGTATPGATGPSNLIPLPSDFFKLRGVDFGSPGQWITIYGFGLQQRNYFNSPYSNMFANYGNQVQRKVRIMDTKYVIVEPINLCSGQYQIWYTPKFTAFPTDGSGDGANLPTDMDTESWIEYAVAMTGQKIYTKLLLPTAQFDEQIVIYGQKVQNSSKNVMTLGPQIMQNVRNRGQGLAARGRRI